MKRAALLIICLTLSLPAAAAASDYIGDFCWQAESGVDMTFGISRVGGGHFLVTGSATTSFAGEITPASGSATIFNGQVFMDIHFTGEDGERFWIGTARMVLDIDTLDGVLEFIEAQHLKSDPDPNSAEVVHQPKENVVSKPCT